MVIFITTCFLALALVQRGNCFRPTTFWSRHVHPLSSAEDRFVATETKVNGDDLLASLENAPPVPQDESLPEAPPLSVEKYLTMQDKRVVVTIRYSGSAGLKPYFLTVAKKVKESHPDVIVERQILPSVEDLDVEASFAVLVDGKVVVGNEKSSKQKVGQVDMEYARSVFVSMQELDATISRCRRKKRPAKVYGDTKKTPEVLRLEVLRKSKANSDGNE